MKPGFPNVLGDEGSTMDGFSRRFDDALIRLQRLGDRRDYGIDYSVHFSFSVTRFRCYRLD